MKVSVVFPTLNEEDTVGACIKKAQEVLSQYAVDKEILISDSSTDNTVKIAEELGARIVYPETLGYGTAYIEGFRASEGDILAMADADGTYDLAELPHFLDPLFSGEADFVIGNRFTSTMEKGAMPWHKKIGNYILTLLLNILFGSHMKDAHCGMRAMTRAAYEKMDLSCSGMEFASEMLVEATRCNLKIAQIPISYYRRGGSPSKLSSVRDGWRHLSFLICRRVTSQ